LSENEPYALIALHDAGYGDVTRHAFEQTGRITLPPWGRIEGRALVGAEPDADRDIHFNPHYERVAPFIFSGGYRTTTAADGTFVLDRVKPGAGVLSRSSTTESPRGSRQTGGRRVPVAVRAGETAHVQIGGTGRPATGQVEIQRDAASPVDRTAKEPSVEASDAEEGRSDLLRPHVGVAAALTQANGNTLSGTVLDPTGRPVAGAKATLVAAHMAGQLAYCSQVPLARRGETIQADSNGAFAFQDCDPQWRYQLLVTHDVFMPVLISDAEPGRNETTTLEVPPAQPRYNDQLLRGRVTDHEGKPAFGASVSVFGYDKPMTGRAKLVGRFTQPTTAIADLNGEFAIVTPIASPRVWVRLKSAAGRQIVSGIPTGQEPVNLSIDEGVQVSGRLLHEDGTPVAKRCVSVVQTDRGVNGFLGPYGAMTNQDGEFEIRNVPANEELVLYGRIDEFQDIGKIPLTELQTDDSGTSANVGDIVLVAAQALEGQVLMPQGKAYPYGRKLLLSRSMAWDDYEIPVTKEGHFRVPHVGEEHVMISVMLPGYHLSPRNTCIHPERQYQLVGVHTGKPVCILLELGDREPLEFFERLTTEQRKQAYIAMRRLQTAPLVGVECP
jgi:protocatechuate 3,4-dioxygenase beta subunit